MEWEKIVDGIFMKSQKLAAVFGVEAKCSVVYLGLSDDRTRTRTVARAEVCCLVSSDMLCLLLGDH